MINTRSSMLTCDNKLTSLYYLKNMPPNTKNAFVSNENNIKTALDKVGGKFPIILKTLTAHKGRCN